MIKAQTISQSEISLLKRENKMAKTKELSVKETTAVALPSAWLQERLSEVQENLDAIDTFRLPKIKVTGAGIQVNETDKPVAEIEGVVVFAKKTNIYYAKPYKPSELSPPDCFSLDGKLPSPSVASPQHTTCKGCPKAEFGTNAMQSGKACRNLKLLYVLVGDRAIFPRQLTVSPTSLKAADGYLMDLTASGIAYHAIKTKIKSTSFDTYSKLTFTVGDRLNEQELVDVGAIRSQMLPHMRSDMVELPTGEGERAPSNAGVEY